MILAVDVVSDVICRQALRAEQAPALCCERNSL
jgi:hypothetical protein